jgi:2-oxoglutarate ferredoxin oxidoreductase subunit alpha
MPEKRLMAGNEAAGEGAIRAGCDAYFGYPITPQNELTAYMARHMPERGRVFIQAESELAAINMVYGAACAGKRAMTSSSSPGVSLKQEGISYISGSRLPAVVINVQRGGPGLGGIGPSQADYFQATRGGGHGDYRTVVLAPGSVQEMFDLTAEAFDIADQYRLVVVVLTDAYLGQMMEPVEIPDGPFPEPPEKPWALTGSEGREHNTIVSLHLDDEVLEQHNKNLQATYDQVARERTRWKELQLEDADVVLVAYGITSRFCREAVAMGREQGLRLGLLRPITLYPFPSEALVAAAEGAKAVLVVEMSMGQMVDDVRLVLGDRSRTELLGKPVIAPTAAQIVDRARQILEGGQE